MIPVQITDRGQLANYFRQDIYLHLYSLGDLDDFYWPKTEYYAIQTKTGLDKVVLLYVGEGLPVLLALSEPGVLDKDYIHDLIHFLPDQVYCHLSPGLENLFRKSYSILDHGQHFKMALVDYSKIIEVDTNGAALITDDDINEVQALFQISYPDNAFDPRMIQTGQYVGFRKNQQLISVGGIHVYSPTYSVAALGNITTHPDFRNQGLGRVVTAKICALLREKVTAIGLNVKSDNEAALHLYQSLGFNISSKYGEFSLKKRVLTPKNGSI